MQWCLTQAIKLVIFVHGAALRAWGRCLLHNDGKQPLAVDKPARYGAKSHQ